MLAIQLSDLKKLHLIKLSDFSYPMTKNKLNRMLVQFVFQFLIKDFTDTILFHFTAVFYVVCRCFIIGRRCVENPALTRVSLLNCVKDKQRLRIWILK